MANYKYTYQKKVNVQALSEEIIKSNITIALDYISTEDTYVYIFFKAQLSVEEETLLTVVVGDHDPNIEVGEPPIMVKVVEDNSDDERSFQTVTIGIDVPAASGWHEEDHSFPIDIAVISCDLLISECHVGDTMEVIVAPDTIIGAITQNVEAGQTEIYVQDSVIQHLFRGYYIVITDGQKMANLGRVLQIHTNSIVVENAPDVDFDMASPTYVMMSIKLFNDWEFPGVGRIDIGDAKIGASLIPANTTIRLRYYNTTGEAKRFIAPMDILY